MSAYIVDREHVSYLVHAAMSRRIVGGHSPLYWNGGKLACGDYEEARRVGQMLWDECIRSVSYRYPNESRDTLPGPIGETFEYEHGPDMWQDFDPVQVLKALRCYAYQSCEHPEWRASEAHAFCKALEAHAISALPGYEEAVWGSPATMAERRAAYRSKR